MKLMTSTAVLVAVLAHAALAQDAAKVRGDLSITNSIDGPATGIAIGDDASAFAGSVHLNGEFGRDVRINNPVDGPATAIAIGKRSCSAAGAVLVGQTC